MYISRRKHTRQMPTNIGEPSPTASINDSLFEMSGVTEVSEQTTEHVNSETDQYAEPLELERELFLEPEEEMTADELRETENDVNDENSEDDIEVPEDPQDLDTGEESEKVVTYEQFLRDNTGDGVLRVQASAGAQSIPLSNVNIVVYRDFSDGRHIFYTVTTNADGVADGMILPAPPRVNSIEGNGESPFASYVVTANREGLRGQIIENVPIFAGVKSIQPVNLAPMSREG